MEPQESYNVKRIEAQLFVEELEKRVTQQPEIRTVEELERQVKLLIGLLTETAEATTPLSTICKKSRPGIWEQAREVIKKVRKLGRKWQKTRRPEDLTRFNKAQNFKKRCLRASREDTFREWVDSCDNDAKLVKLGKMASNGWERSATFTPEIAKPDGTLETARSEGHIAKGQLLPDTQGGRARGHRELRVSPRN